MNNYTAKENIEAHVGGKTLLWRFTRTFFVSFLITFGVLFGLNKVPQGLYDAPHKLYVWVLTSFSFDDAAFIAALPTFTREEGDDTASFDGRTLSTSTTRSVLNVSNDDRGVDWLSQGVQENFKLPIRLTVPVVAIDVPIITPNSTDVDSLDESLTRGVVLYPHSGFPGERNNVLLFGHSSHLPIVNNPAYKALNNLEYTRLGDDIYVDTKDARFHYRVSAIRLTTADEELITFDTSRRMLTLSTCNTFGKKAERFVVEAIFVGSEKHSF